MRFWVALLFVVVLPIALGPATSTLTRFFAGEADHACMCGMKRGTCGCPDCERMEAERRDAVRSHKTTTVHRTCEDGDGLASAPPLPAVMPFTHDVVVARAERVIALQIPAASHASQITIEPSTPPPRT